MLQPADIFGLLQTMATLAVIVLYCAANVALTSYMYRVHRDRFTVWQHVVIPAAATLALVPVLFITLYPLPPWPSSIAPYLFLASVLIGFVYMRWWEVRNPGALQRGATMLVGSRSGAEGDVDWGDTPEQLR